MENVNSNWFSISKSGETHLNCINCKSKINVEIKYLDHHPAICPHCNVKCTYLDWKNRKIQIIPANAPPEFQIFIKWMQEDLDELEYVGLMVCFEEIGDKIYQ